jgi:CheY-like chemotaxis protein
MKPEKHLVVYADDDSDDRELVAEALLPHQQSIELRQFENGMQICQFLQNLPPHKPAPCLIILDINMPVMNGKDALRKLRKHQRFTSIPVILFSTSAVPEDRDFAHSMNAAMITKPSSYEAIRHVAQEFVNACADEVKSKLNQILEGA